jgi:hypothetical protein
MKKISLYLIVLILITLVSVGFCTEIKESASVVIDNTVNVRDIHYKDVPITVTTQINDKLIDLKKRYQLSDVDTEQVHEAVLGIDDRCTDPAKNKVNRDKLRQFGFAALPTLSILLESQDENTRIKAMSAMKIFLSPAFLQDGTKDNVSNQPISLQLLLLRRAMLDTSIKVRRIALIGLRSIAFGQFSKDSDEAVVGINEACSDPDPEIRMRALEFIDAITKIKTE